MNKEQILNDFLPYVKATKLRHKEIAQRLGINKCYISWMKMKNLEYAKKMMGAKPLIAINEFLKSGKNIDDYNKSFSDFLDPKELDSMRIKPVKPEFNDITKDRLAEDLIKAMDQCGIGNETAGIKLGIMPNVITYIREPRYRNMVKNNEWGAIKKFQKSGKSLKEYHYLCPKATAENSENCQKLVIEINLKINGKEIKL